MEKLVTGSNAVSLSQVRLQEYLLVAYPTGDVYNKIVQEKQQFCHEFAPKQNSLSNLYITLARFKAREEMEETIFRYMQRIFMQQRNFEVALNNYSGFPPHSIYLRVQNHSPFKQLTKELQVVNNYINSCACPSLTAFNPHLNIAQSLPEAVYEKAMMNYSHKTFHETFMVNELVLLRKSHEYEAAKSVQKFSLKPSANSLSN